LKGNNSIKKGKALKETEEAWERVVKSLRKNVNN